MPIVEVNGTKIHYQSAGSGPPVVCIHPPLLTGKCFFQLQQLLADRAQLIAFDIRGHGGSEPSAQQLTYPLIASDIIHLLDELRLPQAYLCGYSTGGGVALEAMLSFPDRFFGGILISSMPEVSDWYNRLRIKTAIQVSRLRGKRILAAALSAGNADRLTTFRHLYSEAIRGSIRNSHEYFAYSLNYSCTQRLPGLQLPIQLVYGQQDTGFHRYARLLQRSLPNHTLQWIAKAKHQLPLKNAPELAELLWQWIQREESGRRLKDKTVPSDLLRDEVGQQHGLRDEASNEEQASFGTMPELEETVAERPGRLH